MEIFGKLLDKINGRINFTTEKERRKELTSLEIRRALVFALERTLTDNLYLTEYRKAEYDNGYLSLDTLQLFMNNLVYKLEERDTELLRKEIKLNKDKKLKEKKLDENIKVVYKRDFNISDNLNKGIAVWLERIGKKLEKERRGRKFVYLGYKGIADDFERSLTEGSLAAIERFTYDFIKGALDFDTIAKIRNEIKMAEEDEDMIAPEYAFICFENPYYEFSKNNDVEELLSKERNDILAFAKAIVRRKVVRFQYQPVNHENEDTIILHPHYIRRVGRKYMVYGWGFREGQETNARILNIVLSRVKEVKETDGIYKTAADSKVDYNYDFFNNVIIYDASRENMDRSNPTRVVLKVVRERKAAISGKTLRPLARLMAEPLHHSMKPVVKNNTIDEKYGYVEIYVSDYMYLKRILLPWGADITVESPAELRQLMQDEAKRMMEAYGQETEESEYSATEKPAVEEQEEGATLEGMA